MRPPLTAVHLAIIATQVVLAILFGAIAVFSVDSSDEWASLARLAAALLGGTYLAGVAISALVARLVMRSDIVRGVTVLFGPLLLTTVGVLLLRSG